MAGENKIPAIRFKGFSGEWKFQTIEKLIKDETLLPPKDGNHGGIHPKATDYVDFGIPFIMANNIRKGEIDLYNCSHIREKQADSLQKGFSKEGDILLTHKGTVGEVAVVLKNEFPYLMLTPQVTYYRIIESQRLDNYFLAFSFITDNFQHTLKEVSGGGTRAYIGITAQQKLGISTPPNPAEQTKIGSYFQQLDTLITQHQRKHDKLLNVKKAMLEKMFPKKGAEVPEIRFKGFSEKWEERKLADICALITKGTTPLDKSGDGSINFIKIENIDNFSGTITIASKIAKEEHVNYLKRSQLKENDILFSIAGTLGRVTIINKDILPANTNQALAIIRLKQERLDYITTYLKGIAVNDYIKKNPTVGAQPNLSLEQIENIELSLPIFQEQTKIGNFFKHLDTLLSLHQTELEKLKNIKKACVEKMFV